MRKTRQKLEYAVTSTAGQIRTVNEDNYYLNGIWKGKDAEQSRHKGCTDDGTALFAVCDGLGGEGHGEWASFEAVNGLREFHDDFAAGHMAYLKHANRVISELQNQSQTGMDCTFVGVFFQGNEMTAVNLGDSRIYLIRESRIRQLSEDDSEFALMVKYGVFKEEDYYQNSARNYLTRSIGSYDAGDEEPHLVKEEVRNGDTILLCSDGLCAYVKNERLREIIAEKNDCQKAADALAEEALKNGSDDNITALIVRISEERRQRPFFLKFRKRKTEVE